MEDVLEKEVGELPDSLEGVSVDSFETDFDLEEGEREPDNDLDKLAKAGRGRLRRKKDMVVCVTGEEGEGKTTLAWLLGKKIDKRAVMARNMLLDPNVEKLYEMIYKLPLGSSVIVDELIRIGYSRNWFSKENKFLIELFVLCRYQRKATIFCMPRFSLVDSDLRRRILFWVHIPQRGVAVILRKDKSQFAPDPWHMKANDKLLRETFMGKPIHEFTATDYVNAVSKSPNFVGVLTFGPMSAEDEHEYDELKKPYELRLKVETEDPKLKRLREALVGCLVALLQRGAPQSELCSASKYSLGSIRLLLKGEGVNVDEVKLKVKEAKRLANFKRHENLPELDALPSDVAEALEN